MHNWFIFNYWLIIINIWKFYIIIIQHFKILYTIIIFIIIYAIIIVSLPKIFKTYPLKNNNIRLGHPYEKNRIISFCTKLLDIPKK